MLRKEEAVLKPLFSKYLKEKNIIGFDAETEGITNEFTSCGFYTDNDFHYFENKEEAQEFLLTKTPPNTLLVATNLGFDFNAIFFNSKYWNNFKIIMSGGRLLSAIYEYKNNGKERKIIMIDTMNFVPYSVKVMGEILKIPKLEAPKCLGRTPIDKEEREELKIYNKRDCEVTYKFSKFLQEGFLKVGCKFKTTVASTSMDLFRRKYLRMKLIKEKFVTKEPLINDFIFSGYYGGRTEAFSRGAIRNVKMYDVNSLYPFAMLNSFGLPQSAKIIHNAHRNVFDYNGMSEVLIESNNSFYPELPTRAKLGNETKLIFPNGTFRGNYNHIDIKRAIEQGYRVHKIYKTLYYTKNFFPFKEYVDDLYAKRMYYKKQGSPMEMLYKLLLNSLYGKFAQHKMHDTKFFDLRLMSDEEFDEFQNSDDMDTFINDDYKGFKITKTVCQQPFVFPMFSNTVTAYARNVLNKYIRDGKALYCDTDSVVVNKTLKENKALGGMKVEYDIKSGFIIKPKMYMFNTPNKEVVRIKGVSRVNREKFLNVLHGQSVSYQKFTKLKESLRQNKKPNTIVDINKNVSLEDNKRVWSKRFNPEELQVSKPLKI